MSWRGSLVGDVRAMAEGGGQVQDVLMTKDHDMHKIS